jgi:hypothetical protein
MPIAKRHRAVNAGKRSKKPAARPIAAQLARIMVKLFLQMINDA